LLALAFRLAALDALAETVYSTFLLPDERFYHEWALELLDPALPSRGFEYAPLPAYYMALVYRFFSVDIDLIRIGNIIFSLLGCICVYCITRRVIDRNWALAAFVFSACSAELVWYAVVPLKTSLSFFLFSLLVYLFLRSLGSSSRPLLFALGVTLGLALMVRPNVIMLLPVIVLLLLHHFRGILGGGAAAAACALFFLGVVVAVLPFTLHNYGSTGKITILPLQSGFLFYCTNTVSNPTPFYRPVPFASSHPDEQGVHFVIEASRREGKILTAQQAASYWRLEVLREGAAHPGEMAEKLLHKVMILFSFSENSDHYHLGLAAEQVPFFRLLALRFWVFILLGYAGLALWWRTSAAHRCLSLLALTYLFTLVLYSTGNRFFLPLLAILIPASLWMVRLLYEKMVQKRYVMLLGMAVIFMQISLGRLPITGSGDLTKHYNNLAFIHRERQEVGKAVSYWQTSSKLGGTYSDIATLFLAGYDYQRLGPEQAVARLHTISDTSFMSSAKFATLGDIYQHNGMLQEALACYRQSLAINYGQLRVREEMVKILTRVDGDAALEALQELHWVKQFSLP
jgi:4-amino-4-deoxy-L-arabinose transferase-like glycosyltransferase